MNEDPQTTGIQPMPHYTFSELARAYFPNTQKIETARKNLHHWIARVPGLSEQLAACGFAPRSRVELPPRAVSLMFRAFDIP